MSRRFRVSASMKPGSTAPYPDLLVGPGKAGDILRNSLFEVAEAGDGRDGPRLADVVSEIFGCRLLKPAYAATPTIDCQYLKGLRSDNGSGGLPSLDISTTGSGFHQVLLIRAFMCARPSTETALRHSSPPVPRTKRG